MFLKRIELTGFKSFADKTEMEFVRGITAVVGPNGSGKSNISDGIRWVLGEQSARSLRGGKMEDVIFAGSDTRRAVNFGEVSLTLDNEDAALPLDFSEVTVTRRVHRSGESEYMINRQACRLKDITELFMDTGIGKEAYSIIGQGRIEEILSTKSEDRRGIFEEASGIVKYKSRKKETEKKLAETEQNLLRIHDLISELEDQIEPLSKQSEKALRFKDLKSRLKNREISLYIYQIEQIHASWSETKEKLTALEKDEAELAAVVTKHDAQMEGQRWEARKLDEELEQLQESLLTISEEFEKCEGLGEVLKERSRNFAENSSQLEQASTLLENRFREKEKGRAVFLEKLQRVGGQLDTYRKLLEAEEASFLGVVGGISVDAENHLKAELLEVLNAQAQAKNDIRYAEQQVEALLRRCERLEEDKTKWADEKKRLAARRKDLSGSLEKTIKEISALSENFLAIRDALKIKQGAAEDMQVNTRKWEQRLDTLVSRRDTIQELQNDYDGFLYGVKEVLKAKSRSGGLKGIHGAVAELVKVPAEVEMALETALGAALQNVVVENEASARAAIAFLKQRQLGRATFLPLDVIRGRSVPEAERRIIEGSPGFVGIAVDLIQFEDKYHNIFASLLGQVIVAESLEDANRIAAKCQYRYRLVTLEGDVVNPGGSMTGGSQQKKTANLLGRHRQLEELVRDIAQAEAQLSQLQKKLAGAKTEGIQEEQALEKLKEALEQKRIEEQQLTAQLAPLEKEIATTGDYLTVQLQDLEALRTEIAVQQERKRVSQAVLEKQNDEEKIVQRAIKEAELARKANENVKDEIQSQLTDRKVKMAAAAQEKQSLEEQYAQIQHDYTEAREEREKNIRLLTKLQEDMRTNKREMLAQQEHWQNFKTRKLQCSEEVELKRAERSHSFKELELEENETRLQRSQLKQVEEQLRQTEVKANRLDVELDNLLKKLSEEYELSYELARERYPVPEDVAETQSIVKDLRREIHALGEVNLGAIEEYSRVSERYGFLSEQKNDLMDAKATLYLVIKEMDEEMSRRFKTTFEEIRGHFVGVFAKLFGGGRADLILTEPDKPLNTGIEIVAQPPGKKLQNLQLLSGGERALTAIGLLFSILKVKPVPFCVLDEVEAALDEANVTRFAEYLREFAEETQFIVVTHRKGTMEEADVLYGVTMEEGGVSKLVSVRLEEEEDQAVSV